MKVKSYFEIFFIALQVLCGTNSSQSNNDTRVDKSSDSEMGLGVDNVQNGSNNSSKEKYIKADNGQTNIANDNKDALPVNKPSDVAAAYRNITDVIDGDSKQAIDTCVVASENAKKSGTACMNETEANLSPSTALLKISKAENTNDAKDRMHSPERSREYPVLEMNRGKHNYHIVNDGLKVRIVEDTSLKKPTFMYEHVIRSFHFDFTKGLVLALFKCQGPIPTYEYVPRTILWHESKFIVDDKISYLDFDKFYDNHKSFLLYDDIIDNRVLNIGADSNTNINDTKTCNELKDLVSLMKNIPYNTDFSDLNKIFESESLENEVKLLPLCLKNIKYMETYRCLDVELTFIRCRKEINRLNRIFETYFDKNQNVNAYFNEKRNLFVANVTEVFFKYNEIRKVYILNPMFSAVQIFMPEFYLYIIWKFKHLYSIKEHCEEMNDVKDSCEHEMLLLQKIVEVFIRSGNKKNSYTNNPERLYERVQKYRCFILEYLNKYHIKTLSYVLYKQSYKENSNHQCFDINNKNNLFQLLAFMDHKQMLDDGKIKALFDQIDCEIKHNIEADIIDNTKIDTIANNGNKDTITGQEDLSTKTDTQNSTLHTKSKPLSTDLPTEQNEVNNLANSDVSLMCEVDFDATDEKGKSNDTSNEVKHPILSEKIQEQIRLRKQNILNEQLVNEPKVLSEAFDKLHVLSDYFFAMNKDVRAIKRCRPIVIPLKNMVLVIFQRNYQNDNKYYVAALNSLQALNYVVEHVNEVLGRKFEH